MKKHFTIFLLASILIFSCKKSGAPKITEMLIITVSNVPTSAGYQIDCTDQSTISGNNRGTPFFSISGTANQTYTTNVYKGEIIAFNDNFVFNGVYKIGAIITLSVNGKVILTTPYNEDSGFHSIMIP